MYTGCYAEATVSYVCQATCGFRTIHRQKRFFTLPRTHLRFVFLLLYCVSVIYDGKGFVFWCRLLWQQAVCDFSLTGTHVSMMNDDELLSASWKKSRWSFLDDDMCHVHLPHEFGCHSKSSVGLSPPVYRATTVSVLLQINHLRNICLWIMWLLLLLYNAWSISVMDFYLRGANKIHHDEYA